jgi:hypothetical protein
MTIADRLDSLGIELPPPFQPAGNYLSCVIDEGWCMWAGMARSRVTR